jgi:hypothetical protein
VEATKQEKERKEEKTLSPRNRKACHSISTAFLEKEEEKRKKLILNVPIFAE